MFGNAEEIYLRASKNIEDMILEIIEREPEPIGQNGEVVSFRRRRPEESDVTSLDTLEKVFDYIRMLDADGYPKAFLETNHLRLEFSRASLKSECIIADVRITKKQ